MTREPIIRKDRFAHSQWSIRLRPEAGAKFRQGSAISGPPPAQHRRRLLQYQRRRGSHESLCDYSSDSGDCCVRSCTGTNHHPECRFPQSGTFNASYFHDDQLHDVLQFPGRKLPSHLCVAGAAYSQS